MDEHFLQTGGLLSLRRAYEALRIANDMAARGTDSKLAARIKAVYWEIGNILEDFGGGEGGNPQTS